MSVVGSGGVAYVFPGQGAQHVGMGADLYERSEGARAVFKMTNQACDDDITSLCFHGPADALRPTQNQQCAIVAVSLASFAMFNEALSCTGAALSEDHPIAVRAVAGHSVGMWAAVTVARVLGVREAMKMVASRGAAMARASARRPGGMAAVLALAPEDVEKVVADVRGRVSGSYLSTANVNTPGQVIVGGDLESLSLLREIAEAAGARRVVPLDVAGAFHTVAMIPARDCIREQLLALALEDPLTPVVANLDGRLLSTGAEIRTELSEHISAPLRWWDGVRTLMDLGVSHIVEFGHKGVLTGMIRRVVQDVSLHNVYDATSAHAVAKELHDA